MLDLFAIVVTSIAIWVVLAKAVQVDRTMPWFEKVEKPQVKTAHDADLPVWRRGRQ